MTCINRERRRAEHRHCGHLASRALGVAPLERNCLRAAVALCPDRSHRWAHPIEIKSRVSRETPCWRRGSRGGLFHVKHCAAAPCGRHAVHTSVRQCTGDLSECASVAGSSRRRQKAPTCHTAQADRGNPVDHRKRLRTKGTLRIGSPRTRLHTPTVGLFNLRWPTGRCVQELRSERVGFGKAVPPQKSCQRVSRVTRSDSALCVSRETGRH